MPGFAVWTASSDSERLISNHLALSCTAPTHEKHCAHQEPSHPSDAHPVSVRVLVGSAAVGLWARATDRRDWHRTSAHLNTLGIGSALVAAVPGLVDYMFAVRRSRPRRSAQTKHMLTNVSALDAVTAARLGRRHPDAPPPVWALGLETIGAGLLGAAGWLGGTLVYRNRSASIIATRPPASGRSKASHPDNRRI